jgi:hypothetical protein
VPGQRGFGERELREAESKGHWGFRGMSERAKKIGGKLTYENASGGGARVRFVLHAGRAYIPTYSIQTLFRVDRDDDPATECSFRGDGDNMFSLRTEERIIFRPTLGYCWRCEFL